MYNQIKSIGMHKTLTAHQGLLIIFSPFLMQCHCMGVYILHIANVKHNVFLPSFPSYLLFHVFSFSSLSHLHVTPASANLEFASRFEHCCSCFSASSLASQQAALLLSKQPCFSASSLASQQAVLLLSKQSSLASQQAVLLVLLGRLLLSSLLLSLCV